MTPRNLGLVMIGVLSGMIAWLVTTWYIRPPRVALPAVVEDPLELRGSIEGTIADDLGQPIAQARVCANAISPRVLALEPLPRCTQTDARGRYAIGALLAGAYQIVAQAPTGLGVAGRDLTVMPNERRERIDLMLVPRSCQTWRECSVRAIPNT